MSHTCYNGGDDWQPWVCLTLVIMVVMIYVVTLLNSRVLQCSIRAACRMPSSVSQSTE